MVAVIEGMTVGEASRCLGVAPETLRKWAQVGRLPATVTPYDRVFDVEVIHPLAADQSGAPVAAWHGLARDDRNIR